MIKEEWNKDEIEKYNFKRKLIQNKKCFEKRESERQRRKRERNRKNFVKR